MKVLFADATYHKVRVDGVVVSVATFVVTGVLEDEARRILAEIVGKYAKTQSRIAAWMEDSIPEGLTAFDFPAKVRPFLRTNNKEENLNRQIKQRTRLIPAFPNIDSLPRMVSAICAEISDDREANSYRYMSTIKEL